MKQICKVALNGMRGGNTRIDSTATATNNSTTDASWRASSRTSSNNSSVNG